MDARLTLSLAIEALRLMNKIFARLDIVGDNGQQLLCAFTCSPAVHDRICAFGAFAEDFEDDGTAEDCHRTAPREMPARPVFLPVRPAPIPVRDASPARINIASSIDAASVIEVDLRPAPLVVPAAPCAVPPPASLGGAPLGGLASPGMRAARAVFPPPVTEGDLSTPSMRAAGSAFPLPHTTRGRSLPPLIAAILLDPPDPATA